MITLDIMHLHSSWPQNNRSSSCQRQQKVRVSYQRKISKPCILIYIIVLVFVKRTSWNLISTSPFKIKDFPSLFHYAVETLTIELSRAFPCYLHLSWMSCKPVEENISSNVLDYHVYIVHCSFFAFQALEWNCFMPGMYSVFSFN